MWYALFRIPLISGTPLGTPCFSHPRFSVLLKHPSCSILVPSMGLRSSITGTPFLSHHVLRSQPIMCSSYFLVLRSFPIPGTLYLSRLRYPFHALRSYSVQGLYFYTINGTSCSPQSVVFSFSFLSPSYTATDELRYLILGTVFRSDPLPGGRQRRCAVNPRCLPGLHAPWC